MRLRAGILAIAVFTAACATEGPQRPARLGVGPAAGLHPLGTGTLVVRRDALAASRSLLRAADAAKHRLVVTGPGLATPFEAEVPATPEARVPGVPMGTHRLVTFEALDAAGAVIPGGRQRALLAIGAGDNEVRLSPTATLIGDVYAAVLGIDEPKGTKVAQTLDVQAFAAAVAAYPRALGVAHPGLLSATAIADATHAAGGTPPAAQAAFVAATGRVLLRPKNWPTGLTAVARLGDPVSGGVVVGDRPVELKGLPAGAWALAVTPARAGLAPLASTVTVTAGGLTEVELTFGATTALANMPKAVGATAHGVVAVGGQETLFVLGGVARGDAEGDAPPDNEAHRGLFKYAKASGWAVGAEEMGSTLYNQPFAVHGGKLYAFSADNSVVFDPAADTTPRFLDPVPGFVELDGYYPYPFPSGSALPATPEPTFDPGATPTPVASGFFPSTAPSDYEYEPPTETAFSGATAVAQGDAIFITGGDANYGPLRKVVKYVPATEAWTVEAGYPTSYHRYAMAGAAVNGTLYFAGGSSSLGGTYSPPSVTNLLTAYVPETAEAVGKWRLMAPMPTARGGAVAVATGGRLYVIGGHDGLGRPLPDVESYDPATDTWRVHPPLAQGRAFAAAGVVGGKIVVAGGLGGHLDFATAVLAASEEVTP